MTVVVGGRQSPGIDDGLVVWVSTILFVCPLAGVNAPVKPAVVHFVRAADTVKPSSVGTSLQAGGGVGVGTGVGVADAAGVGLGEAVGVGDGVGDGVIAVALTVILEAHAWKVPATRVWPMTVKLPLPLFVMEPVKPRSSHGSSTLFALSPTNSGTRHWPGGFPDGVGTGDPLGVGPAAPIASENTTAVADAVSSTPDPKSPERRGVTSGKVWLTTTR